MDLEGHIEFLLEIRRVIQGGLDLALTDHSETNRKLEVLLDAQRRTESSMARLANARPLMEQELPPLGGAHARVAEAQVQVELALRALLESVKHLTGQAE